MRHSRAAASLDDSPLLELVLLDDRRRAEGMIDSAESRRWVLGLLLHEIVRQRLDELRDRATGEERDLLAADFASGSRERESWSALYARYLSEQELAMSEVSEIASVGRTTVARRLNAGLEALAKGLRERELSARQARARLSESSPDEPLAESRVGTIAPRAEPTQPATPRAADLPKRRTPFVGRAEELAEVQRISRVSRHVTLTGAGGSGKTRLALEIARMRQAEFAGAVYWVDLAPHSGEGAVPQAVAEAVDISPAGGQPPIDALVEQLGQRRLLLVLDNCEHVIEAVAGLVDALLVAGDGIEILATSQEALGIEGERAWLVPPLALPPTADAADPVAPEIALEALMQGDAITLFSERARVSKPGFEVTEENAPAILEICRRLDGLPLAIELAAARVRLMSPAQIAARLDQRFQLLTRSGQRLALPRHQTLRACLDWSYALLDAGEKLLLQRVSTFAGGWSFEDVEALCGGEGLDAWLVIDTLGRLVDKSFVIVEDAAAETRYRLQESIREYAFEMLDASGDAPRMLDAHAAYFLELAERAEPELRGPGQAEVLQQLAMSQDNFIAAIERGHQSEAGALTSLRLACALGQFWSKRNVSIERGRELVVRLLENPWSRAPELLVWRAKALIVAGNLTRAQGNPSAALGYYQEAHDLALEEEEDLAVAKALSGLGKATSNLSRYAEAKQHMTQALEVYRRLGDKLGVASSLNTLGVIAEQQGDTEAAVLMHQEGVRLARELGDELPIAISLGNLAQALQARGEEEEARRRYLESVEISKRIGDRIGEAWVAQQLGDMAQEAGRYEEAEDFIRGGLRIYRDQGNAQRMAWCRKQLGELALLTGRLDEAEALAEESLGIFESTEIRRGIASALGLRAVIGRARGRTKAARRHTEAGLTIFRELGEQPGIAAALFNLAGLALDEGDLARARRLHQESLDIHRSGNDRAQARSWVGLGHVSRLDGDVEAARACFGEALRLCETQAWPLEAAHAVESLALVDAAQERFERAATLLGAADALLQGTPLQDRVPGEVESALVALGRCLPRSEIARFREDLQRRLGATAFDAAWRAGAGMSPSDVLASFEGQVDSE